MTATRSETTGRMTAREREALAQLVRRREKVAKADASAMAAERLASFEAQLASEYAFDDDHVWKRATEAAQQVVNEAQARVAARCEELGIPASFAPSLHLSWYARGENASRTRQAELRKVAQTRIASMERAAKAAIERSSVEVQTQLIAGGLDTDAARAFLEAMPTAEALMPPVSVGEVEALRLGDATRAAVLREQHLAEALAQLPDRATAANTEGA